jgi:hypothetical protein
MKLASQERRAAVVAEASARKAEALAEAARLRGPRKGAVKAARPGSDAAVVEAFVSACLARGEGLRLRNSDMWAAFVAWGEGPGWSHKRLTQALTRAGHEQDRRHGDSRQWVGLALPRGD